MTDDHCKDCCCARSWKALGIESYTGKSIPEEITALKTKLAVAREALIYCSQYPMEMHPQQNAQFMVARNALAKIGEVK